MIIHIYMTDLAQNNQEPENHNLNNFVQFIVFKIRTNQPVRPDYP